MHFDFEKALTIVTSKLEGWLESLTALLPNMVVAVFILAIFYVLSKLVRRISTKLLDRISDKKAVNDLFSKLFYLITLGIGLIVSLNVLQLTQTVSSLLAGAGIIGLALGFAFQDITANFISGILIAFRKPIQIGDIIETQSFMGTVDTIDLRATTIKTFQGLHVIIPNKEVFQLPLTNYTKTNERRIDLEIGVSYAEDLESVQKIAIDAIQNINIIIPNSTINAHFSAFGDSSINFTLMFWIHYPDEPGYLTARSNAIIAVKKAFDAEEITIPFPIRTLDFGIKGGEKLSDQHLKTNKIQ